MAEPDGAAGVGAAGPQDDPPEVSFLCDAMLGGLSRWLRASGYDAAFEHGIDDGELVRRGQQTGRIVLSSDAGVLARRLVRTAAVRALFVPRDLRPAEQAAFVLRELHLPVRDPRCMACGGELSVVPAESARGEVPPDVIERHAELWRCARCGKILWKGRHWAGIARGLAIVSGSILLAVAGCGARADLPGSGAASTTPQEPAEPSGCQGGLLDCDGDPANGCEVDPQTDPDHCGACDRSCRGGACVDGVCQRVILVSGIDPGCLALDEENVYVSDTSSGAILRAPKEPGDPVVLASEGGTPFWLVVQGGWVYWAAPPGLWRVPTSGGAAGILAASNLPLGHVALDEQRVYVADYQVFGSILAAPIDGGDFETLVPFTAMPSGLVVDGGALYWAEASSALGQVMKLDLSDTEPVVLAQDQQSPLFVVLDESYAYWNTFIGDGAVSRVPRSGGPIEIVAGGLDQPSGVALAGGEVYFTTFGDLDPGVASGAIARAPRAGGAPETVLGGRDQPFCVVMDEEAIYWAELGARAVYKLAR